MSNKPVPLFAVLANASGTEQRLGPLIPLLGICYCTLHAIVVDFCFKILAIILSLRNIIHCEWSAKCTNAIQHSTVGFLIEIYVASRYDYNETFDYYCIIIGTDKRIITKSSLALAESRVLPFISYLLLHLIIIIFMFHQLVLVSYSLKQ